MTRKEFSLVSAIIQNIGKRNYEKLGYMLKYYRG